MTWEWIGKRRRRKILVRSAFSFEDGPFFLHLSLFLSTSSSCLLASSSAASPSRPTFSLPLSSSPGCARALATWWISAPQIECLLDASESSLLRPSQPLPFARLGDPLENWMSHAHMDKCSSCISTCIPLDAYVQAQAYVHEHVHVHMRLYIHMHIHIHANADIDTTSQAQADNEIGTPSLIYVCLFFAYVHDQHIKISYT